MKNGNGKIVQYKDYVAGWLDSTVAEFLGQFADVPTDMAFALVTCLDSHRNPAALLRKSPELRAVARSARAVGTGILLPTDVLLTTSAKGDIFYGFDEVWFFPHADVVPKPDTAWLVGPHRVGNPKLRRLGRWMAANDCTLGLGDGEGLNFVVKAGGLLRHLLGHSLLQPEHAIDGMPEAD